MPAGIHGEPARIHTDRVMARRREVLFTPAEGVEKTHETRVDRMKCLSALRRQRVANFGCAAVATSLDDELTIDLAEFERDVFTRGGDARAECLESRTDRSRFGAQELGDLCRQFCG